MLYKDAIAVLKESKLTPDEFLKRFIENHSDYNKHNDIELKLKTIEKEIQITFENNMQGKIKPVDYLTKMKQLNSQYSILEQQLEELPTQIDIKLLQYKYYEFVNNMDKELKDKDGVIKSTIKKVHVDLTNNNPIIDISYIFE